MATDVRSTRTPRPSIDVIGWMRENLFSTWYNSLISLFVLFIVFQVVSSFFTWALTTPGWQAVTTNTRLILVGRYPAEQIWRPAFSVAMIALLTGLSGGIWKGIPRALALGFGIVMVALAVLTLVVPTPPPAEGVAVGSPLMSVLFLIGTAAITAGGYALGNATGQRLRWPTLIGWFLLYPIAVLIIRGFGPLDPVATNLWGGLMLTLLLSVSGIVLSFPLGVLLALGRRSDLPVIKGFCIAYIELIRGVPLVTVLFMAQLMLPLFLPSEVRIDAVVRAIVAVTLFSAAYLAENVRGGLQSLPRGQTEAARALGLNTVQTTLLITLPQALRAVIPVLVGQFISLFKDTSLVVIVGLIDLLGIAQSIITQPQWLGTPGGVWREVLFSIALIYWIFSFTMSRTSKRIEENLNVGHR